MLILITNMFPINTKFPTKEKELLINYAIEYETGKSIIVPCVHPSVLGARFSKTFGEWVLD